VPLDPEFEARVADLTGVTPDVAEARADRIAPRALIDFDGPGFMLAPVAIYAVDLAGRIRAWNRSAERLFGWSAEEVTGEPIPFVPEDAVESTIDALKTLLAGDSLADLEYSPTRKDGTAIHVVTSASMVDDESGEPALILTFALDVTERENARRALEQAEHRWRRILDNISDTITILDRDGRVKETTGQFARALGYPRESWEGTWVFDLVHPGDRETLVRQFSKILEDPGIEHRDVFRARRFDGQIDFIEYTAVNLLDDPAVEGIIVATRHVTSIKQAETLLEDEADLLELIARDAPLSETLPAISRMVEYHSDGWSGILLLEPHAEGVTVGSGGSLSDELLDEITRTSLESSQRPCAVSIRTHQPVVVEQFDEDSTPPEDLALLQRSGISSGWAAPIIESRTDEVLGTIIVYHERSGEPSDHERDVVAVASHLAAIAIDRDRVQGELLHQARHHQLTGLPNRHSILEVLDRALGRARSNRSTLAVMVIDLDRFKVVNDSLGHAAGDRLLVGFGDRLSNLVRPTDYVGHFSADEFVVVLEDIADVDDVRFVANRLDLALSEPFSIEEGDIFLAASIGVAVSERGHESSDTLLQNADAAMYQAKALGRDRLEVFDDAMRTRATEQLRLDRELRRAVERSELALHYQPQIDLTSGRIVGVEALLRWHHPERGLVMPVDFIPIAEDTGLIVRIGRWVIDEAVLQARTWIDRVPGLEDFSVAVNLSARQISAPDIVSTVARILERHELAPAQLSLELTESILIDDAEATLQVLRELKALGVQLAIDDFGTGFSSLSYLHRFPVDVVKVDRTFVTAIRADGEGSPVASAVVHMARALDLLTTAEGVEEPQQLAGLRALGCDLAQGYLFAKPVPSEDLERMLHNRPHW